ncbi:hypothetical protein CYMTET_7898 [Cymbomonas tetramitiformis]|uniref:Uncharacterized protein n=1 Tax=Cymbomonas tetramitiformis TaxID=36881 RepID=A0AAE0GU36_9CHLO|nr:hypothetical protein CYMTET_7898 [Cymbomonas tetramitiformis]
MRLKRLVKLLKQIRKRQDRIHRSLARACEALGHVRVSLKRKKLVARRAVVREKRSVRAQKPSSPSFATRCSGESVEISDRSDEPVDGSESDEEGSDGSVAYLECTDDTSGRALAVWIHQRSSTDRLRRSMCVVVDQAVLVQLEDGSDSPARIRAVNAETARVLWPEQLDGAGEARETGDTVPIESVQGEPCVDGSMHGPAWGRNASRAVAHPRCWFVTGDSEVGCYVPWGWSNFDRADSGSAPLPSLLRNLWTSVLSPALDMGVEVRADRGLKRAIESHILSPLRELRVDALESDGTECELCKRACSKRIFKLSFARREPAAVFGARLGRTCAATCALAYECVTLLYRHMQRAPLPGESRFELCSRRRDLGYDNSWRIIDLFSGRILTARGGDRCNLRDDDADFDVTDYLKSF